MSLRTMIELSGNGGEVQITSSFSPTCGGSRLANSRPTVLLVATSRTPLATAALLAWWLEERTVLKQVVGSTPFGVKRYAIGASVPEVDCGSPMPNEYFLLQAST